MKDLIEITKKQIIPDREELETVQAIFGQYQDTLWDNIWAATLCYLAGKIAGKREERARRHRAGR